MTDARWKVVYVPWWKKIPLYVHGKDEFRQIGWVSGQRAYLVNNLSLGWIAFADQQTPENIEHWFCPHCKASIWGSWREKIENSTARDGAAITALRKRLESSK